MTKLDRGTPLTINLNPIRLRLLPWLMAISCTISSMPLFASPAKISVATPIQSSHLTAVAIYQKYPELAYLADHDVDVTSEAAALKADDKKLFPSQRFFDGVQYPEFDRSILSLLSLDWISRGDKQAYEQFISVQHEFKLSWESFQALHRSYKKLEAAYAVKPGWKQGDLRKALEVALVMGDLGKSRPLHQKLSAYGIKAVDHDDFHAQLMQTEAVLQNFACFRALPKHAQELLKKTADLAHFGHISHLEGGARMFSKLKRSGLLQTEPEAFEFAWLVHICDVAGAQGHKYAAGAKVMNQITFENMQLTYQACQRLAKPNQDEKAALQYLLEKRIDWLGMKQDKELDDIDRQILARLSAMLRLTPLPLDKEQSDQLAHAYHALREADKKLVNVYKALTKKRTALGELKLTELGQQVRRELSIEAADKLPLTPTYVPALLLNAVNTKSELKDALAISLPLLSSALLLYREGIADRSISSEIRLNFNQLAERIGNGEQLNAKQLTIDSKTGQVQL